MLHNVKTNTATQETATLPSTAGLALPLQQTVRETGGLCAQNLCQAVCVPHNTNISTATQDGVHSIQ